MPFTLIISHLLHTKRAFPFSLALRIRCICFFRSSNCVVNELTQAEYRNRRGYNLGLLKQEIQRVPYHTRSHKRLTHTFPSSCRLPPSHSLNILYFPPTHLHSLILPTLCYYPEIYTSLDQSSSLMLCSYRYTLFKVRYLSARSSRMGATGGHLDRVYLELLKGRGTVWAPRSPPSRYI